MNINIFGFLHVVVEELFNQPIIYVFGFSFICLLLNVFNVLFVLASL